MKALLRPGLALALALAPALTGCLQAAEEVAPATVPPIVELYGLGEILEARVPLPDGLSAHGTLYLPDAPEGTRFPTIMDLGPYYGNINPETSRYNEDQPPNRLYAHFLERGYAIALVSLRGTGQSEGCFKIGGAEEQQDAAAIVEWLAAQEWSDGTVAMTGVSYDGTTPWEAAVTGTPSLKAIVPVEGISDMYRYTFFDGVPVSNGPIFQTYYEALVDWAYLSPQGIPAWAAAQATNLCPEQAEVMLEPYNTYRDGVHGPYWDERDTHAMVDRIQAATFVVHGFQDWNVRTDEVQDVWARLPEPKRMLLGQWEHNIPWRNSLNRDWDYAEYNDTILQWFDAFLRNDEAARAAALAAPPVLAQDSSGRWWNLSAWPPVESVPTALYLGADRKLNRTVPSESGEVTFRTEPTGSVPREFGAGDAACFYGGRVLGVTAVCGATLDLEAAFVSETLTEPLLLMGNPTLSATVSVDRAGGYLAAVLYDVDPFGNEHRVSPGFVNLATRTTRDEAEDVPVGEPFAVTVKFYAIAHAFPPGHRLKVTLAGSDFDIQPASHEVPTYTVHIAPETPAVLAVPVFRV
ncbi:MAG: CocE/NonD family hydrolase [Methanobacteriota archaeon]